MEVNIKRLDRNHDGYIDPKERAIGIRETIARLNNRIDERNYERGYGYDDYCFRNMAQRTPFIQYPQQIALSQNLMLAFIQNAINNLMNTLKFLMNQQFNQRYGQYDNLNYPYGYYPNNTEQIYDSGVDPRTLVTGIPTENIATIIHPSTTQEVPKEISRAEYDKKVADAISAFDGGETTPVTTPANPETVVSVTEIQASATLANSETVVPAQETQAPAAPTNTETVVTVQDTQAPAAPTNTETVVTVQETQAPAAPANTETVVPTQEAQAPAAPANTETVVPTQEAQAPAAPANTETVVPAQEAQAPAAPANTETVVPAQVDTTTSEEKSTNIGPLFEVSYDKDGNPEYTIHYDRIKQTIPIEKRNAYEQIQKNESEINRLKKLFDDGKVVESIDIVGLFHKIDQLKQENKSYKKFLNM